ncbi:MAG: hypothetical protein ABJQ98_09990 [Alloalcanivorax venustensis]|jgi:hypothetical protein|uniref:hypothetical protein n=1 Tax=Alloalcanivorax venustensis TaxID=172371 RepID=UPI001BD2AFC1|nr:MAG: hypothetical protein KFB92_14940 [Alcanivorax sp.]
MRNLTVLLATGALTGTLFLAGCQPPEEDDAKKEADDEETVPHPPIEESRPGEETGAEQTGGPADGSEEEAGGGYESAQEEGQAASGEDAATYTNEAFRVQVDYPESLQKVSTDQGGDWHAFAGGQGDGQQLLVLKVPGEVDARFQLGASRSTQALSHCKDMPEGADQESKQTLTIDEVPFARFDTNQVNGDTYEIIRSYRATYTESCYAIDLIASGSGGQGEAADRQTRALEELQTVLDGVSFTE